MIYERTLFGELSKLHRMVGLCSHPGFAISTIARDVLDIFVSKQYLKSKILNNNFSVLRHADA